MALNRLIYETEEEDREVLGKMTSLPVLEGLGISSLGGRGADG
jgi:hypothetical protein